MKCRRLLETFKEKKLRSSENLAQNEISQYKDSDRRWSDLIICPFFYFLNLIPKMLKAFLDI